jgi:hypothetical protein
MRFGPRQSRLGLLGALVFVAVALAGCSNPFDKKEEPKVDPNLFPSDYKSRVALFLQTYITDREGFRGAGISAPVLKPFGSDNRYVVCVRLNGSKAGDKAAVFFGGALNQFSNATEGMCAGAAYEPYRELEAGAPK